MKVTVALKTPTVICVSGNLVSSASDITDQCDVRLEEADGGESHSLPKQLCNYHGCRSWGNKEGGKDNREDLVAHIKVSAKGDRLHC